MNKITAHSLDIKPTQTLELPLGAKLLTVNVDHRFNKCLLWTLQDDDAAISSEFTFLMGKLGDEATGGMYVGTFKDNSGYVHVFAKTAEKTAVPAPTPTKPVLAEAAK